MDLGLAYSVVAALLLGTYLYAIKRYFEPYPSVVYVLLVEAAAFGWYLPIALFTLDGPVLPAGAGVELPVVAVGVSLLTAVALLSFVAAIRRGAVSYVAPISKLVPVFVLPIEVLALGAILSPLQVAGVLTATVAVYVANYEPGELLEPFRRALVTPAAQLALLSAATFGVVDVGKRYLMQELSLAPQVFLPVMFALVSLSVAPIALRQEWPDRTRRDLPRFLAVGLVVAVANHLVMLAFQLVPASIASPIVNTQAVVAVILGGVLLREENFGIRLVAAGLAVGGIAMIAFG